MAREKPARLLLVDPPWPFGDKLPGEGRGAEKHYATMSIDEIKTMPLPPIADDALLLMWRVSAMVEEAYDVTRTWGFTPKSEIVWVKTTREREYQELAGLRLHFGMGRYVRASHESCILAVRGRMADKIKHHDVRSVFFAPAGVHSEKPDAIYKMAERLVDGPRVELFARRTRPGWTQYGNELGKLDR